MGWELFMPETFIAAFPKPVYQEEIRKRFDELSQDSWSVLREDLDDYSIRCLSSHPFDADDDGAETGTPKRGLFTLDLNLLHRVCLLTGLAFFLSELLARHFDAPVTRKQVPLAIMRNYSHDDYRISQLDRLLKKHFVKNVTWLSPCVCALGYFKKTSGIVIDIGAKHVGFGVVCRGKEVWNDITNYIGYLLLPFLILARLVFDWK